LMEIVYINLKKNGKLDLGHVRLLLEQNENIALLSLQLQSSQIGVTQELKKIGELKKNTFPTIHIDASQGVFYNNVNMQDWNADTLTICAQKIHGPKGSGILLCKPDRVPVREGTPAAPLIAGVSHALTEAQKNTHKHALLIQTRRKELFQELRRLKVNFVCNGEEEVDSLVVNMSFPKDTRDSEQMIIAFDQVGLEVSSKSACMGSQAQDSILLSSMGLKQNNSVRISLHHDLGSGDIKKIAKRIKSVVR